MDNAFRRAFSGMSLLKKYIWIVLGVTILIGIVVLLRIPQSDVSNDKENRQSDAKSTDVEMGILRVFAEAHINAVRNVGNPAFVAYVTGPLQKICPFYVPDGVTYRDCLSGLVERGKAAYDGSKSEIKSFDSYCQSISDQYTGIETMNLYFSCMAYKLNAL